MSGIAQTFSLNAGVDADGDGFGDVDVVEGVAPGTDCDDEGPAAAVTFPGAAPLDDPVTCMKDADADDFGDAAVTLPVVSGTDCNDDDGTGYHFIKVDAGMTEIVRPSMYGAQHPLVVVQSDAERERSEPSAEGRAPESARAERSERSELQISECELDLILPESLLQEDLDSFFDLHFDLADALTRDAEGLAELLE